MNKFSKFYQNLAQFSDIKPVIYMSPSTGYRARSEFGIRKGLYTMIEKNKTIFMNDSTIPHSSIQEIMSTLLHQINNYKILKDKLFQINFRTSGSNLIASLIYHKRLDETWKLKATYIKRKFKNLSIIGRSKNQMITIGSNELIVEYQNNQLNFKIIQNDLVFFQPNFYLYYQMILFIIENLHDTDDLLELYCGCGGFTLPLATKFKKVFATENNRHSIKLLNKSIELNKINNINIARLSDDETYSALLNNRMFKRLKDLELGLFNFSHFLVDPPRSGLSKNIINLSKKFKNIIYISCNPETFFRDIKLIGKDIKAIALFDQFSNTNHIEVIALLK